MSDVGLRFLGQCCSPWPSWGSLWLGQRLTPSNINKFRLFHNHISHTTRHTKGRDQAMSAVCTRQVHLWGHRGFCQNTGCRGHSSSSRVLTAEQLPSPEFQGQHRNRSCVFVVNLSVAWLLPLSGSGLLTLLPQKKKSQDEYNNSNYPIKLWRHIL